MLIGLLGGECTGKSALATSLHDRLGLVIVPEALRAFVDAHARTPRADEQAAIMAEQERLTTSALQAAGSTAGVVADPAAAMTAVYSQIYFDDASLLERALEGLRQCDLVVWCQPDFPWEPDGLQRDGEEMRGRAHEAIAELLGSLPAISDGRPRMIRASGPLASRVNSVRDALAAIGS